MKYSAKFVLAAAVVSGFASLPASAQEPAPVRVALILAKTGPLATCGIQMEQGFREFLKTTNSTLGGRKIELTVGDTTGTPAGTKSKVQEAVERFKADVMVGPVAAYEALAVADYIMEKKIPVVAVAASEDMTQRKSIPWFIRTSASAAQASHPLGEWAAVEKKYKRIATIADDIAYGHENVAGFQRTFEENGGKIVKKLWSPINTADYGPFVAQMQDVDAIYVPLAGSNGIKFIREFNSAGLKGKISLLAGMTTTDDHLLKSMGDDGIGIVSSSFYSTEVDSPSNKKLTAAMKADYSTTPSYCSVSTYVAGQVIDGALKKLNGSLDDKSAFMNAMRSLNLTDTPRGPFRFDEMGNAVGDIYIKEIVRKDSELVNAIIKTYPDVSQFWKWSKDAYLANPVYSRDFPPAKNLGQ
ncbi:branched-chain amino acid transport system substrate-binding protein [Nitrobacteraceae bacterium AZCC 2161]